jgi:DNA-binding MurR/RpiR family transcriptional regulator
VSFAWSDTHIMLTSAAVLTPGDVAIGLSHTGVTAETVEALRIARGHGATTVALTSFPRSPIREVCDHLLTTVAPETTFRSGATASRIAQLTVIDCQFIGVAQRHLPSARKALKATYDAVGDHRLDQPDSGPDAPLPATDTF